MPEYVHGHHPSVLRAHSWRTAQNSCAYMLPYLSEKLKDSPDVRILDVGCGPGTITCDLALIYPTIRIIGIEPPQSSSVLSQARSLAQEKKLENVTFEEGDVFQLQYPDESFDIVHVHQVIQHIPNRVNAVKEIRRVLKPGGFLAARETDWPSAIWYPSSPSLQDFQAKYAPIHRYTGGDPEMGRKLHALAAEAGFEREKMKKSSSGWCFSSKEEREWYSQLWMERIQKSQFRNSALESGETTEKEMAGWVEGWRAWGEDESGWHAMYSGEIVAFK